MLGSGVSGWCRRPARVPRAPLQQSRPDPGDAPAEPTISLIHASRSRRRPLADRCNQYKSLGTILASSVVSSSAPGQSAASIAAWSVGCVRYQCKSTTCRCSGLAVGRIASWAKRQRRGGIDGFSDQVGRFREDNPSPLYLQLQNHSRRDRNRRVQAARRSRPSAISPTEYAVSRITVRKAIDGLVERGAVDPPPRRGHLRDGAASRRASPELSSFSEDMVSRGRRPHSVGSCGAGAVTPEEALSLGLSPGARSIASPASATPTMCRWRWNSRPSPAIACASPDAVGDSPTSARSGRDVRCGRSSGCARALRCRQADCSGVDARRCRTADRAPRFPSRRPRRPSFPVPTIAATPMTSWRS